MHRKRCVQPAVANNLQHFLALVGIAIHLLNFTGFKWPWSFLGPEKCGSGPPGSFDQFGDYRTKDKISETMP